jgi:hypothetical protein
MKVAANKMQSIALSLAREVYVWGTYKDNKGRKFFACGWGDNGNLGITLEQPNPGYLESLPIQVPLVHEPDKRAILDCKHELQGKLHHPQRHCQGQTTQNRADIVQVDSRPCIDKGRVCILVGFWPVQHLWTGQV